MDRKKLEILYEDNHIIVCVKPHGIATQSSNLRSVDMVSLLKNHIKEQNKSGKDPYIAVIHRLDQPVAGILVFAKTPFAAKELNKQLQNKGFGKYYRTLVNSPPPAPEGTLENYLVKDAVNNTSRICDKNTPNAKFARLYYKLIKKGQGYFNWGRSNSNFTPSPIELEIILDTGRHHQIRVQLAHIGCPIIGDTKYNPDTKNNSEWQYLMLCAYKLCFRHPKTNKEMNFSLSIGESDL